MLRYIRERCKKSVNLCSFDKGCKPKRKEDLVLFYIIIIIGKCTLAFKIIINNNNNN